MALDDLLATLERRALDTPDTPCNTDGVSARTAPIQACTPDTRDTRQNDNNESNAETMAGRPDAESAEPFDPKPKRQATAAEATELRLLYDTLAARNGWPMPDSWYGDRAAILGDPDAALVTLRGLVSGGSGE